jgi:hypothetical protein
MYFSLKTRCLSRFFPQSLPPYPNNNCWLDVTEKTGFVWFAHFWPGTVRVISGKGARKGTLRKVNGGLSASTLLKILTPAERAVASGKS